MKPRDPNDILREQGADGLREALDKAPRRKPREEKANGQDEPAAAPKRASWRDRFTLIKLADITLDDEPPWLIEELAPAGPSLGVIFGKPKSGKTFLVADLMLHVAMGRAYCGLAVQQGAVVYITKEGVRGFKRRMLAMRQHYNIGPEVPFYVANEMPNFGTNNGDAEALVALIRKLAPGEQVAVVVIDTLARTMPGQNEDTAAMSQFVENCNIVAGAFDCFIAAIHHSPRSDDNRSRGSNVLDGAADIIISVIKNAETGISTAKVEDVKDSEAGLSWRFRLTQIELWERNQNRGFTPLCETLSEPRREDVAETRAKPKLPAKEQRFFDILCDAVAETGKTLPVSSTVPPKVRGVTRDYFKKCLLDRGFCEPDKPDSVRALCSKYINQLSGRKVIGSDNTYVWLLQP